MKDDDLLSRIWTDVTTLLLPLLAMAAYVLGWSSVANVLMLLWLVCFYGTMGGRPMARSRRFAGRILRLRVRPRGRARSRPRAARRA